jgi:hypothetical protein
MWAYMLYAGFFLMALIKGFIMQIVLRGEKLSWDNGCS